tara:strand:- start:44 stop:1030 length:987 start_codon:yes stop_codon:yes gene_type:complete
MRIFVTGADGFIGSHLTERLLSLGHNVTALSYYNSFGFNGWLSEIKDKNKLKIIYGDIRDYEFIEYHTKRTDIVFHLAALISIPHSYRSYNSFLETNVIGTTNLLTACNKNKVKRIVVTSTSEVYGSAQFIPIKENHPLNAQSPYAASKISADQISLSFYKSFNLPVLIIRPFNTFGPRQSTRAIIPTIITQALTKKNLKLGNITTIRDFTYISDTINGFISTIKPRNIEGQIINIASGFEISIKDLIKEISSITGINKKIYFDKKRIRPSKSEVNRLLGSNKKALRILNWKPKYQSRISFRKALKDTINWYKNKKNLTKFDPINLYQ